MNKLRKKIFWTLFIILSLFQVSILFIFNYQIYSREKINIKQNIFRLTNGFDKKNPNRHEEPKIPNLEPKEENPKRFMDATIYTILLDQNNEIYEVISHTEDGLVKNDIKKIALKIINDNNTDTIHIGNLYFNQFSYQYEKNNCLILIDNSKTTKMLISTLEKTAILFVLDTIAIVIISKMFTDWLIKPVIESFNKQKEFITNASHELKTPLSIIMACAETLEENPYEKKWLDNIKNESDRMSKLITSLLDLAKIENENNKELYEEINLSKLIEKVILSFESLAYEKNIKLDYEISANILFKCRSEEIQELISILLDNAFKHSSKKGHIIIKLQTIKNNNIIEVINKGKPIPKGEEEKIFERFYRLDKSHNRNENRYGLGLAIAKSITQKYHGQIFASSNNGYTTFKIILKK